MKYAHRFFVGLMGLCLSAGCVSAELQARLDLLNQNVTALRMGVKDLRRELNDSMNMALCSPELSQLLSDVQKECTPVDVNSAEEQVCTTKQIRGAVIMADPEHRGRFIKLMSHVRHEVLYLREGTFDLVPLREERLNRLAHQAILRNTRFLVVSSPEGGGQKEAERRADQVAKELIKRGVGREIIQRWIYSFPIDRKEIERMTDLPGIGETQQLNRGVWIFRADC